MKPHRCFPLLALFCLSCAMRAPPTERAPPSDEGAPGAHDSGEGAPAPGSPGDGNAANEYPWQVSADGEEVRDPFGGAQLSAPETCEIPARFAAIGLDDLLGDPEPWDGELVAIEGTVFPEIICKAMECPPEAACCRPCRTGFGMNGTPGAGNGVIDRVYLDIPRPACVETCACDEPGGVIGRARVWGKVRVHSSALSIEPSGFCAL